MRSVYFSCRLPGSLYNLSSMQYLMSSAALPLLTEGNTVYILSYFSVSTDMEILIYKMTCDFSHMPIVYSYLVSFY